MDARTYTCMDKTCSDVTYLHIDGGRTQHAHMGGPIDVLSLRIVSKRFGPCERSVVVGLARPSLSLPEQASVDMEGCTDVCMHEHIMH